MAPLLSMIAVCAGSHLRAGHRAAAWWEDALKNGPSVSISETSVSDKKKASDKISSVDTSAIKEKSSTKTLTVSRTGAEQNDDGTATTGIRTDEDKQTHLQREEAKTSQDSRDSLRAREQKKSDREGVVMTDPNSGDAIAVTNFTNDIKSQVATLSENNSTASNASLDKQENSTTQTEVIRIEGKDTNGVDRTNELKNETESKSTIEDAATSSTIEGDREVGMTRTETQEDGVDVARFDWDEFGFDSGFDSDWN